MTRIAEIDTAVEVESLSRAITILDQASRETCAGPFPIWQKITHAKEMLEDRVGELIGDPQKADLQA